MDRSLFLVERLAVAHVEQKEEVDEDRDDEAEDTERHVEGSGDVIVRGEVIKRGASWYPHGGDPASQMSNLCCRSSNEDSIPTANSFENTYNDSESD